MSRAPASRLRISAADDGLLLHAFSNGAKRQDGGVRIEYGDDGHITTKEKAEKPLKGKDELHGEAEMEIHGLIGLLPLASSTHLICITEREEVAQIREKSVYAVKDVALISLESREAAEKSIRTAAKALKKQDASATAESVASIETEGEESDLGEDHVEEKAEKPKEVEALELPQAETKAEPQAEPPETQVETEDKSEGLLQKGTGVLRSVVTQPGSYGRFAQNWFSKGRKAKREQKENSAPAVEAKTEPQRVEAKAQEEITIKSEEVKEPPETAKTDNSSKQQSVVESLTPRILRSARLYFSSSGFFFSYEHDLSRRLLEQGSAEPSSPLWKSFDTLFFWNRNLMSRFVDAGHDSLVLPLMQGFVGQRAFSIAKAPATENDAAAEPKQKTEDAAEPQPDADTPRLAEKEDFLLTLLSRRSVHRAGLRYLRRGVDEKGYVANSVETEQLLSPQSWDASKKTFSLVQTRGSIPLFFSQTPYSFKPLPTMFGSESTNQTAFKKHFQQLAKRYHAVQAVSLVDKHATEAAIGEAYERHAKMLNDGGNDDGQTLGFEWFDFHHVCKGMKFENVSILITTLQSSLTGFGWNITQNDQTVREQQGILRTNCMDCLDRTNVVQSAVGGWVLQQQLEELGMKIDLQTDPQTQWFNTLWADNGDFISKQYAGTSALKGDFTRTRKRHWTGALSDFSLTLNRYYNNIFGDYFLQTCIDYYLGNAPLSVFEDFETDMMNQDYALDVRRIRQNAIDLCVKIVLEDPAENLVAGWTLSCPHEANTFRTLPFEECVWLLTSAAVYFCRFDWDAEKVGSFERIDLLDIIELWRGAYITSTLSAAHMDEAKNVGFAFRYKTGGKAIVRTNTRSLGNEVSVGEENEGKDELEKQEDPDKDETRMLAFKALPPKHSAAKKEGEEAESERELVKHICEKLHEKMTDAARKDRGIDHLGMDKVPEVQDHDVVSVAEARKSTKLIETIGYSLKKLVWSYLMLYLSKSFSRRRTPMVPAKRPREMSLVLSSPPYEPSQPATASMSTEMQH